MDQDAPEKVRLAIEQIGDGVETLLYFARELPDNVRDKYLNPESFGPLSALLGLGKGYESASRNPQFHNFDDFVEDITYAVDWRKNLHPGDEVMWNDPDNGECSRKLKIGSINIDDEVFHIVTVKGDEVQGYLEELS